MHSLASPPGHAWLFLSALTASQLTTVWSMPQYVADATPDRLARVIGVKKGRVHPGAARMQYPPGRATPM